MARLPRKKKDEAQKKKDKDQLFWIFCMVLALLILCVAVAGGIYWGHMNGNTTKASHDVTIYNGIITQSFCKNNILCVFCSSLGCTASDVSYMS